MKEVWDRVEAIRESMEKFRGVEDSEGGKGSVEAIKGEGV